jgi:hypothetical protein
MAFFSRQDSQAQPSKNRRARRPQGVSRRRKRELGFEPLEDRRVMSAESPIPSWQFNDPSSYWQSFSSSTPEGQAQILANEIYWQSLMETNMGTMTEYAVPTDPLLNLQWHLINSGQQVGNPDFQPIFAIPGEDINVGSVWNQNIFGMGVTVAIFEPGTFQSDHPDLEDNVGFIGIFGGNETAHATAVAGVIGAVADNGIGGTGVAPGVTLIPLSGNAVDPSINIEAAIRFAIANDIDVINNSWGPEVLDANGIPQGRAILGPTATQITALRDSVRDGRGGLGIIHVFAAGNNAGAPSNNPIPDLGNWDSATYNGWINSRYTIGVTGVDHDGFYNNIDGTVTSYPETSASVLIAGLVGSSNPFPNFDPNNPPGNVPPGQNIGDDTGIGSAIVTTDLIGEAGFNQNGFLSDRDFLADTDYTSRFTDGTSAAAAQVSGVVALMLEVNPNLNWRDVQEILLRSARQNAEFETPTAAGQSTQNLWIVNQTPLFHDPDPFNGGIDPDLQTLAPTLDPLVDINHYAPTPQVYTNGAGYTISQGRGVYGENIGYAHGVVDAELAVQLAQQWHTKNQNLPGELTWTNNLVPSGGFFINLPARQQGNMESGFQVVPGGLGGVLDGQFIDYWNEYYAEDPFSQPNPPVNDRGSFLTVVVPANNTMTVETIELKVLVGGAGGGIVDFMDHVRVVLISPDGTHHELNNYYLQDPGMVVDPMNATPPLLTNSTMFREGGAGGAGNLVSVDVTPGGDDVITFSSNRSWGERSDPKFIFDPLTKEPIGGNLLGQGWQIHMENYSGTRFEIEGMELVFHGSPVAANTFRLQGLIGVDDDQDNDFNFGRTLLATANVDGDPATVRYGEVQNFLDTTHESMGANVTVVVRRASDNVIVDRFVTGADGNYYFDLVPDDYIISVEDPEGRVALEDTLSPNNVLQDYRTEWTISEDFFKVWDYDQNLEAAVDANGVPLSFGGTATPYHVKDINFLLDPGPPVAPQVQFSGTVIADLNDDGIFNNSDVNVPNVTVYADVNRNGQLDPGEVSVQTNANGQYNLVVSNSITTVINVGIIAPPNWAFSDPSSGFAPLFVEPGDVFTGINFNVTPPAGTNPGNGSTQPGYLLGSVYEDLNTNGSRQAAEQGVAGIQVFVDANNNGTFEVGERTTTTNSNGAFVFANMPVGTHRVRIVTMNPLVQISPTNGGARVVSLSGGGSVSGIEFGIGNTANQDFGDLPTAYGSSVLAASHGRSLYFLGMRWDAEIGGQPSANADGDDSVGADEDGVVVTPLVPGTTATVTVTASRHGGVLQGWVDFNGDNDFNDPGERIFTNASLSAGANTLTFQVPASITSGNVYARFRYGEYGINSVTGAAAIGEVEDYVLVKDPGALPAVIVHGPDFNEDGRVDGRDMMIWQRNYGRTNALPSQGDANGDGLVGYNDLVMWRNYYGTAPGTFAALNGGDDDSGDQPGALAVSDSGLSDDMSGDMSSLENDSDDGILVEAILIIDTYGGASGSVFEVSAQASTVLSPAQRELFSLASALEMRESMSSTNVVAGTLETADIDVAFEGSSELTDLGLALRNSDRDRQSVFYRFVDEELDVESDEENVFELAFAEEADWRQF